MTPTVTCTNCSNAIEPGQSRYPTDDGTIHGFCQTRQRVRDAYRFYVDEADDILCISLWRQYDDREVPVLVNTGGRTILTTESKAVGDGEKPTEDFVTAFGYTLHWLLCYGHGYVEEEVEDSIEDFYDDEIPEHERWALHWLLGEFFMEKGPMQEIAPLRQFATECTQMPVPEVRN